MCDHASSVPYVFGNNQFKTSMQGLYIKDMINTSVIWPSVSCIPNIV